MSLSGKITGISCGNNPDQMVRSLAIGLQSAFYYCRYYSALQTMGGDGIFS